MSRLSIKTNKAVIHFVDEELVEKVFFERARLQREWRSLTHFRRLFPGKYYEGWTYQSVEPISKNAGAKTITMRRAPGVPGELLFRKNPALVSRHMGIALALFHRETEDPTGRVVLYSDFSRSYVVIDPLSQQLTLIDPGDGFGQLGDPERDVFVGAYSILVGALKSGRIPTIPVRTFVRSYANVRPLQVDKARLQLNFRQLELNAKSRKKTSIKRIFMRIVFRCLSIYLIRMIVRIE